MIYSWSVVSTRMESPIATRMQSPVATEMPIGDSFLGSTFDLICNHMKMNSKILRHGFCVEGRHLS